MQSSTQILWQQYLEDFLSSKPKKPLIVLLGTTASGKTNLSIRIAKYLESQKRSAEVINGDSRQCYKYLDVGTAKITSEEMQGVLHHLLDVLDPKQECTISWYATEATKAIDAIHARGNLPMLVGGSMLYISSIIDGLQSMTASDPAIRKRLSDEYDLDQGVALYAKLLKVDPESVAIIPRQNKVYLLRALEIFETTGKPKSAQKSKSSCPYDLLILGVEADPEVLRVRINDRTAAMLKLGWVEEVRLLLERGYTAEDPGMKSHGYREVIASIKSVETPRGGVSADIVPKTLQRSVSTDLCEKIASQIRRYAKRQRTWWRGDERIRWIKI